MPTREVRNKARLTVNTIILLLKLKDANEMNTLMNRDEYEKFAKETPS